MKYYEQLLNDKPLSEQLSNPDTRKKEISLSSFNLEKTINNNDIDASSIVRLRSEKTEEEELIEYASILNEIFGDENHAKATEEDFKDFNKKADILVNLLRKKNK